MAPRRSARVQDQEGRELTFVKVEEPSRALNPSKKRRAPATQTVSGRKKSAKVATETTDKCPTQFPSGGDLLSSLPTELLELIIDNIEDKSTMGKLTRTCKTYYNVFMPLLHKRLAVAAMYHAHIQKLIPTIEPYLTIAQKRQLKKEGTYKGQQEQYSSHLDANTMPACSSYVRQMIIGHSDPGRKHQYIVYRYIEELLKNLRNLEIVETCLLTESMAESIASLKTLKALRLISTGEEVKTEPMRLLSEVKDLKHLNVEASGTTSGRIVETMLLNSALTLRSLVLRIDSHDTGFLHDWEQKLSTHDRIPKSNHTLPILNSLTLTSCPMDAASIQGLQEAINLIKLRELNVGSFREGGDLLFQHLKTLTAAAQDNGTSINLRKLFLDMSFNRPWYQQRGSETMLIEAQCDFLSSFNTLTALHIQNYGLYSDTITTNPGLSNALTQGILKHSNLKSLIISCNSICGGEVFPLVPATTVAAIIDNLSELEDLRIAIEPAEVNDIGSILSRAKALKSFEIVWCQVVWNPGFQSDDRRGHVLTAIIHPFLSRDESNGNVSFIWEDHFKLNRVTVGNQSWELGSKLGKHKKGMKKMKKMTSDDGRREVYYRDVTGVNPIRVHVGFDYNFGWVEKVAKDMA
ncbi:Hypothetical protein R9X50_00783500 [Acrodontium crateriforme]|uniref:F-box domain-containing protein n=1 Tax=Acrodontium crateriforme TaxID=150365 RepID=A0AAQ3MCB9_9PEZI|nr:Hypothetical protein R9X50_00783500 [Acrodontium crateriforme]